MFTSISSKATGLIAAAVIAAAVGSQPAVAGTIPLGTFQGSKAGFYDVTESGATIPPSLFTPLTPVYSQMPNPQLSFAPQDFNNSVIETSGTAAFDLKYKASQLSMSMQSKGTALEGGYAFTGTSLTLGGDYSVWAPFAGGQAKVTMAGVYSLQVTGVDWAPWSSAQSTLGSMVITPSDVTSVGPQSFATTGSWSGSANINWDSVKAAAGVAPGRNITGALLQFTVDLGAASVYGTARTSVTNFNVNAPVDLVAVPEPPTLILAGLGAAGVLANGYRRRKQRQPAGNDAGGEDSTTGAIASQA
jgi:hypothetical protein